MQALEGLSARWMAENVATLKSENETKANSTDLERFELANI